jgi:hypothetical protein
MWKVDRGEARGNHRNRRYMPVDHYIPAFADRAGYPPMAQAVDGVRRASWANHDKSVDPVHGPVGGRSDWASTSFQVQALLAIVRLGGTRSTGPGGKRGYCRMEWGDGNR